MKDKTEQRVKSKSYTLNNEHGRWLGQIVLTEDGMFSACTDWGNYSWVWRHFGGDFRQFLVGLNQDYFAGKMYACLIGNFVTARKHEKHAIQFTEKILPELQRILKIELECGEGW